MSTIKVNVWQEQEAPYSWRWRTATETPHTGTARSYEDAQTDAEEAIPPDQTIQWILAAPLKVDIWVWKEKGRWLFETQGGTVGDSMSFTGVKAKAATYVMAECIPNFIDGKRPDEDAEKRSLSASVVSPLSSDQTDRVARVAPAQADISTAPSVVPPVVQHLQVPLDLLPLLQDAVDREIERTEDRIQMESGTKDLSPAERRAVTQVRKTRLEQLQALRKQLPK